MRGRAENVRSLYRHFKEAASQSVNEWSPNKRISRLGVLFVQFQYLRHELDDLVVLALLGGVGEVEAADGELSGRLWVYFNCHTQQPPQIERRRF